MLSFLRNPSPYPTSYRVQVRFHGGRGWVVSFYEENVFVPVRTCTFEFGEKILAIFERAGEDRSDDARIALELALEQGRDGGFWIRLAVDEFRRLQDTSGRKGPRRSG